MARFLFCQAVGGVPTGLLQPEPATAHNLAVDDDVYAIGARSQRARTHIIYVLAVGDPEV